MWRWVQQRSIRASDEDKEIDNDNGKSMSQDYTSDLTLLDTEPLAKRQHVVEEIKGGLSMEVDGEDNRSK